MNQGWKRLALGYVLCVFAQSALADTTTTTLDPGANITRAVELAAPGDVIQLNPGDYYPAITSAWNDANAFGITKAVRIVGLGTSPAQVKLHGGSGIDYAVKITRYNYGYIYTPDPVAQIGNPSGASLENLTIDTGNGGIMIFDSGYSTRLTDITIKNVVIETAMTGGSPGVLLRQTDRVVMDNVTVTSYQSGFLLKDANDSLMMNSTVTHTAAESAAGLGVLGGSGNTIVGNTFGTVKADPALNSNYSFAAGGAVFYNSQANRFENNTVQGHRDDGLDFHALDLTADGIPVQQSINNYAGKNNIVSTGYVAGRTDGSGIWINCSSNNTWLYANDVQGAAEGGAVIWHSINNMLLGNSLHNNRFNGIGVSGGVETTTYCPIVSYRQRPVASFLHSNNVYFNGDNQVHIRDSDATDISLNSMSRKNGFGGAAQTCLLAECQAALVLEGDPGNAAATSNGVVAAANTSLDNVRGLLNDDGKITGFEYFSNRVLLSTQNRFVSSGQNLDWGPNLGGNYWSQHTASGNPSTSTPYTGVFQDTQNHTGSIIDRYPYQTEDLGRGHGVTVYEPGAGSVARGTRRTVRWYAPGCAYVDVALDGSSDIASNVPNIGYAVVTIPVSASIGAHTLAVKCKDSSGVIRGQGSSSSISVTDASLQLLAPGRDDVFNAGQQIFVGWKKTSSVTTVDIDFSSDKGATFTPLLTGQTGTFARVTLPTIESTAYAVIRVKSGSTYEDSTDGVFAVRGTGGAGFANVSAGRKFSMGQMERLEWASPQNSRLVDITATVGGSTKPVATNLPDRGNFDWVVPEMGAGAMTLTINFKTTSGSAISSASISQGSTLYPTTITFGPAQFLTPGGTMTVSASTNSLAAVTFSSLTASVCTVSGSTVTGVSNGTCTLAADAPATGNYNVAPQVTQSFTVGASQAITFGTAPTLILYGTAAVSATASSGLPVTFSSLTTSVCTVSGSTVSGLAVGTCTIAANQAGNGTYGSAVEVTQSFAVVMPNTIPRLANISTRGKVQTGDNVMIGGFIIQGSASKTVLIRAGGPSMANSIPGTLPNPKLDLYSGQTVIASNDDWGTASNAAAITATTLAPANALESAILITLQPGAYTAIVSGVGGGTGVGIIEVFAQ